MEQPALRLTTPTEVVLALYDACNEVDAALAAGDDAAALSAMRSIADLVATDASFHVVEAERVATEPVVNIRRILAGRGRPGRVVVHGHIVVALAGRANGQDPDGAGGVDVFRVGDGRVAEGWCLVAPPG